MSDKDMDDEYVANLLKQDAKQTTKKYDLVGLEAFNPKRARTGAPKPNTNFLRHIIRQTDSHNASLLAKEAEESRARLKQMNRNKDKSRRQEEDAGRRRAEGRLTPPMMSDTEDERVPRPRKRRRDYSDNEDRRRDRVSRRHEDDLREPRSRRRRDESHTRHRKKEGTESNEHSSQRKPRHSNQMHERSGRRKYGNDEDGYMAHRADGNRRHKHRRRRTRSTSKSRSRSQSMSPRPRKRHRPSSRLHRSPSLQSESRSPRQREGRSKLAKEPGPSERVRSPASDSDPLEAIVGPLPPPTPPTVRTRGRGALKANSTGIDSRFSSTYDPSTDVHVNSDAEDEWGDALEALKDRKRWQQQGADRLRAAGFSDAQVKKWENGDEKSEEDVVWSARGEDREWDRGKVLDKEGDVTTKPEWGRLA